MREYTKEKFLGFIERLDKGLTKHVYIIAIGGTALSLLELKDKTKDIDFFIRDIEFDYFNSVLENVVNEWTPPYKVDYWIDGEILFVKGQWLESRLPPDYFNISLPYEKIKFEHVTLRILHPVDLIVTKVGRLNELDKVDITNLIRIYKVDKHFLEDRFNYFLNSYTGNRIILKNNFNRVIKENYSD